MSDGFELLLVKDAGNAWEVVGITYSNVTMLEPDCVTLRATLFAIEACKKALSEGKKITISKTIEFSEVQPKELVIDSLDGIAQTKQIALNTISAKMHQLILSVSIIDAMDFMQAYMQLLNAGIFITDANREDKYLEIIEKSQEIEMPLPLGENASFEDEQRYITAKKQYDDAQANLVTLEKYLNAYDKLFKIKHVNDALNSVKLNVENASSADEINKAMSEYDKTIAAFK